MHVPAITANYLAILSLIYAALALQVIRLRRSSKAPFSDGGDENLRSAIRAHGNFMEYVPIITLMVAVLEMSGASPLRIHLLMGALLLSRLLHPLGMYATPGSLKFTICRQYLPDHRPSDRLRADHSVAPALGRHGRRNIGSNRCSH